jgi:WD40-like Beta Propeller Repeat
MAVAAVSGGAVWLATRASESAPPRVSRLQVTPADAAALTISADYDNVAITPDGARLVYVGDGGRQLFVRALDALEPVSVFTGVPRGPFVSPDGQWIGFVDRGAVKKIPITGGPAVTLAALDGPVPSGATWGPDDTIIFATTNRQPACSESRPRAGRRRSSRGPMGGRAKPITLGRNGSRVDRPHCSQSGVLPAASKRRRWRC